MKLTHTTKPAVMFFEYHCLESEKSQDAILWHHTRQPVLVLGKLDLPLPDVRAIGGNMYRVMFADGLRYDVFCDELLPLA